MKKRNYLVILLLVIYLLQYIPIPVTAVCDPSDSSCILAEQFGLNQSQIPKNPEDIKQLYLKMRWTEVIEKNRVLGPIHQLFTKGSWLFTILFNHPYEFSLTLFVIIVLWFLLGTQIAKIFEAGFGMKGTYAFLIGMLGAIILAQIRVIEIIANFLLDLIFKQDNWWIRLIIIIVIIVVATLEYRVSKMAKKYINATKGAKTQEELQQKAKEIGIMVEKAKER